MGQKALVLFAHGSQVESANQSVRTLAERMAQSSGLRVEAAFLECAQPSLGAAVARLAGQGIGEVVVVPYFLTTGTHLQRDLPVLLERARERHPQIGIRATACLEGHPALVTALLERATGMAP